MLYNNKDFTLDYAKEYECDDILSLIKEIANYEKMSDCVTATSEILYDSIFGTK